MRRVNTVDAVGQKQRVLLRSFASPLDHSNASVRQPPFLNCSGIIAFPPGHNGRFFGVRYAGNGFVKSAA